LLINAISSACHCAIAKGSAKSPLRTGKLGVAKKLVLIRFNEKIYLCFLFPILLSLFVGCGTAHHRTYIAIPNEHFGYAAPERSRRAVQAINN